MNKKGISMVALVITIIVLIILTAAVVITGINAPTNAQSAIAKSDMATVQEAVTLYILNATLEAAQGSVITIPSIAEALEDIYESGTWQTGAAAELQLSNITDEQLNAKYDIDTTTGKVIDATVAPANS